MLKKKYIFSTSKGYVEPNTVIGGMGSTITSKSALESFLGLSPGDVSHFTVIDGTVEAIIDVNYNIGASKFLDNTDITSYLDIGNKVGSIFGSAFQNATNLAEIKFEAVTTIHASGLRNTALTSINLPLFNSTLAGTNIFAYNTFLHTVSMPSYSGEITASMFQACPVLANTTFGTITSVSSNSFYACSVYDGFNWANVTTVGAYAFAESGVTVINAPNLTAINTYTFNLAQVTTVNAPELLQVTIGGFYQCYNLTSLIAPKITYVGIAGLRDTALVNGNYPELIDIDINGFYNCTQLETLYIPKCTIIGANAQSSTVFQNIKLGCVITVGCSLSANNNGGADGDLVYARDTRSANINYENCALINTKIGGISSVINTETLLLNHVTAISGAALTLENIHEFQISGDDISFYVDKDFVLGGFNSLPTGGPNSWSGGSIVKFVEDKSSRVKELGSYAFAYQYTLERVIAPACIEIEGSNVFDSCNSCRVIYTPLCVKISAYTYGQNMFLNTGNQTIYVDPFLETVDSGKPDGDLVKLVAQNGIVRYVTDFTPPSAVNDLSVLTVYKGSIKLQWSAPTSVNQIDYYEIYVDGVLNNTSKNLNGVALKLVLSQSYDFSIIAVDIFYNKSPLSNVVTQVINGEQSWVLETINNYYKFNDNLVDSVGARNGTGTGESYSPAIHGNGVTLPGTSTSKVVVADYDDFSFTDGLSDKPFTISISAKFIASSQYGDRVLSKTKSDDTSKKEWEVYYNAGLTGNLVFRLWSSPANTYILISALFITRTSGTFYNLVFTYNGDKDNPVLKTYVDGNMRVATLANTGYVGMSNTAQPLYIGNDPYFTGVGTEGTLDELTFLNRELSELEVKDMNRLQSYGELT